MNFTQKNLLKTLQSWSTDDISTLNTLTLLAPSTGKRIVKDRDTISSSFIGRPFELMRRLKDGGPVTDVARTMILEVIDLILAERELANGNLPT